MSLVALAGLTVAAGLLGLHVLSALLAARRWRRPLPPGNGRELPAVSVVRPVCGLDPIEERTLATSFHLEGVAHEVIFCAAREDDAALPFVRGLMRRHPDVPARILVGGTPGAANPKLDNVEKGWRAARHDWIVLTDSNVVLPPDYLQRLHAAWRPGTGLVSAPPLGIEPKGLWAEVECAFLDTYQGRWQYAADSVGNGYAQGKTLFFRRDVVEDNGGLAALRGDLAEDAAATKLVRRAGLHVRLADRPFCQPIGRRTRRQVWQRQLRWAQLRRSAFPRLFALEILTTPFVPLGGAMLAAEEIGASIGIEQASAVRASVAAGVATCWYGTEALLARTTRIVLTPLSPLAWIVRDAMIVGVWCLAWMRSGYEWHGHRVTVPGGTHPADEHAPR